MTVFVLRCVRKHRNGFSFMKPDLIECLAIATYLEAAHKITEELDARGFTTDNPENADNLEMVIAEIIQNTIRGNTNFSVADGPKEYEPTDAEMEEMLSELLRESEARQCCDGWEGDLTNQGPPDDENPLKD